MSAKDEDKDGNSGGQQLTQRPSNVQLKISNSVGTAVYGSENVERKYRKQKVSSSYLFLCFLLGGAVLSFYRSSRFLTTTIGTSPLVHRDHNNINNRQNEITLEEALKDFRKRTNDKFGSNSVRKTSHNDDVFSIDQPERPIRNPIKSDGNSTFSSCLLVMDDNHRLAEFLAYHYHVLPLRYLIIAVDPRSRTSPTKVLNRYRRRGMFIEEWNDFHFLARELAKNEIPDDAGLQIKRDRHRIRQKNFYRQCLRRMKMQNRTWVTLIDTDEYLMYNHKSSGTFGANGKDPVFEEWEERQLQRHAENEKYPNHKKRVRPSIPPPPPSEEGGIIRYIHQEAQAENPFFSGPCISCPRLQFGAKESTSEERLKGVPLWNDEPIIDPIRLDTLRFRKHAERQDFIKNGLSKSVVDVSRIDEFPRIESLHRPFKKVCPAPWRDEWSSGLRIHHYLGSWEEYSFRDDSRRGGERSIEGWAFKAQDADDTDDNIRPWIDGFVDKHGAEQARDLLKGAGLPPGYKSNDEENGKNWTMMFLDEILGTNETKGNDIAKSFNNFVRDFHFNKNQKLDGIERR